MVCLAVLKIISGDFERGFDINLQTFENNKLLADINARLPDNPEIEDLYRSWLEGFRDLKGRYQNSRQRQSNTDDMWQFEPLPTHRSTDEGASACRLFFERLEERMRDWLQNSSEPGWREIREKLVALLTNTADEVQVIIKTDNGTLWKLPWHVWDLIETNPDVEIAFSPLVTEAPGVTKINHNNQVTILAVLGNSDDIDIKQDEDEIRRLRDTEPEFLLQPSPQEIIQKLHRKEGWDIFFFAGHSETEGERGRIYINESQYLEIRNFRYALQEAVRRGLKLAIFNSCDGLGLAQLLLTDSHIPVVIVMRESVPDQVAQLFLRVFLREFADGQPLYISFRQARRRLEEFQEIPGATGLPVIFQNSYTETPTWKGLRDKRPQKKGIFLVSSAIFVIVLTVIGFPIYKQISDNNHNLNCAVVSSNSSSSRKLSSAKVPIILHLPNNKCFEEIEEIEGKVTLQEAKGKQVWIVIKPAPVSDYYVQAPVNIEDDGTFKATVHVGDKDTLPGTKFTIRAFVEPNIVLNEADKLNNWPKARLFSDTLSVKSAPRTTR